MGLGEAMTLVWLMVLDTLSSLHNAFGVAAAALHCRTFIVILVVCFIVMRSIVLFPDALRKMVELMTVSLVLRVCVSARHTMPVGMSGVRRCGDAISMASLSRGTPFTFIDTHSSCAKQKLCECIFKINFGRNCLRCGKATDNEVATRDNRHHFETIASRGSIELCP